MPPSPRIKATVNDAVYKAVCEELNITPPTFSIHNKPKSQDEEPDIAGVGSPYDTSPTYPCNFCGYCETPDQCAWSRDCPVCGAPKGLISPGTMCRTVNGDITSLHAERWKGGESQ